MTTARNPGRRRLDRLEREVDLLRADLARVSGTAIATRSPDGHITVEWQPPDTTSCLVSRDLMAEIITELNTLTTTRIALVDALALLDHVAAAWAPEKRRDTLHSEVTTLRKRAGLA